MRISKQPFGQTAEGTSFDLFILENDAGMVVKVTNYGGIITSVRVPDRSGVADEVVMGFDTAAPYLQGHPYYGAAIGRFANRIAGASFELRGQRYRLAANNGNNHLHGGLRGFDKRVWTAEADGSPSEASVALSLESPEGDEGYPGDLSVEVIYTLTEESEIRISYTATAGAPTPVNLTNHSYFNLAGFQAIESQTNATQTIVDHQARFNAGRYLRINDEFIPTGEIAEATGPMDFRSTKAIGNDLEKVGGYDHCYLIDGWSEGDGILREAVVVYAPSSGRILRMSTDMPAFQFYTGNMLVGQAARTGPAVKHQAFCLEAQYYPDSPNRPEFPSCILLPGETFNHQTVYAFAVE